MKHRTAFKNHLARLLLMLLLYPAAALPVRAQELHDQSTAVLTLSDCLTLGRQQNLQLESGRRQIEALNSLTSLVRSQWLPRVIVYGLYMRNDQESVLDMAASMAPLMGFFEGLVPLMTALGIEPPQMESDSEPAVIQHQNDFRAGGSVSLEFQPASLSQYSSASLAVRQGESMISMAEVQLDSAVTDLYYALVSLDALTEVALRNIETRRESLRHVQERYSVGTVNQLDVLRAEMSLAEAESQVEQLRTNFEIVRTQMANVLQIQPNFEVVRPADPPQFDTPEEIWNLARDRHPNLLGTATAWEIAQHSTQEVRWSWAPILNASFNVNAARTTAFSDDTLRWDVTLRATWPIYLGGARLAQLDQRSSEEAAAYLQHLDSRASLQTQIETAFLERRQLEANLALARRQYEMAQAALNMAQAVYEEGLGTQLDLIQAESMVFGTELQVVQTEISLAQLNARIYSMTGRSWSP